MKQVTGPTKQRMADSAYVEPCKRTGCHNCGLSKSETANSRLRCTRGKPWFTVNKLGICPHHTMLVWLLQQAV